MPLIAGMPFIPQPYPLYAVPLTVEQDPLRFELVDDDEPIRLVIGWSEDKENDKLFPYLDNVREPWTKPVLYAETRERAGALAKSMRKATRHEVRMDAFFKAFPSLRPAEMQISTSD